MSETDSNSAEPLPAVTGGCLCGAVRFEAWPPHREGYYCHCRMCQQAFGNTRAAFINVSKSEMQWTGAEPTYFRSSRIAKRGFCNRCGTPMTFEYNDSERIDLSVGSFDDPAAFWPTSHFSIDTRIENWHADDGLPGERFDQNERITSLWQQAYGPDVVPGNEAARAG